MLCRMLKAAWICCTQQVACTLLLSASLLLAGSASISRAAAVHSSPDTPRPRTWAYFGIQSHHFAGSWLDHEYQAIVFLRVVCLNHTFNTIRMVVSLHDAPMIRTTGENAAHSDTPAWYLQWASNSSVKLPRVLFRGPENLVLHGIAHSWEYHAQKMTTAALMADIQLPRHMPFILAMQGSERLYQVPKYCSPKQHPLFRDDSMWLGVVASENAYASVQRTHQQPPAHKPISRHAKRLANSAIRNRNSDSAAETANSQHVAPDKFTPSEIKRFLVHQHLQHHMQLGFAGSIMVVMQHTAEALLQSRELRQAVSRRELVLVLWDVGLEPRASHFMQIPANNLLRLAAWGSTATLAFWDLDEFLVLPRHQTVQQEVQSGCLQGTLLCSLEVIMPGTWVSSATWDTGAEVLEWAAKGDWSAAVASMHYVGWPYASCSGVCKVLVNPNTDMLFQVHGHNAGPNEKTSVAQLPRSCAYLLHFYRLWGLRTPQLMTKMGAGTAPGVPLKLQEVLPQSSAHLQACCCLWQKSQY